MLSSTSALSSFILGGEAPLFKRILSIMLEVDSSLIGLFINRSLYFNFELCKKMLELEELLPSYFLLIVEVRFRKLYLLSIAGLPKPEDIGEVKSFTSDFYKLSSFDFSTSLINLPCSLYKSKFAYASWTYLFNLEMLGVRLSSSWITIGLSFSWASINCWTTRTSSILLWIWSGNFVSSSG